MKRRQFTPEFKTKIVLELLREEKTLSEIASEHDISPNQLFFARTFCKKLQVKNTECCIMENP